MDERYKDVIRKAFSDRLIKLWDLSDRYSEEGDTKKYDECYEEICIIRKIANEFQISFCNKITSRF